MNGYGAPVKQKDIDEIPKLGCLYWHWIGKLELPINDVKCALVKNGFSEKDFYFADPKKAYHSALRDIRRYEFDNTRILVRRVNVSSVNVIRHQVTFESLTKAKDSLLYKKEMFTQFDKRTNSVAVEIVGTDDEGLESKVNDTFDSRMKHATEDEVRQFIRRRGRMLNHIICKPRGGIWFVPESSTPGLLDLENFVVDVGGQFYTQPIFDTSDWRSDVGHFVDHDFDIEVEALNRKVKAQLAEGKPKKKALETLAKNYHNVITKARTYERLLNYRADHLREVCEAQTEIMEKAIRGEVDDVTVQLSSKESKKIEREEEMLSEFHREILDKESNEGSDVPF
tara:strand:+ start:791 stop:1810 length:1020 start_codon:yes stop_codon:yes gene_type:complete